MHPHDIAAITIIGAALARVTLEQVRLRRRPVGRPGGRRKTRAL
jgi:hypothetical protein